MHRFLLPIIFFRLPANLLKTKPESWFVNSSSCASQHEDWNSYLYFTCWEISSLTEWFLKARACFVLVISVVESQEFTSAIELIVYAPLTCSSIICSWWRWLRNCRVGKSYNVDRVVSTWRQTGTSIGIGLSTWTLTHCQTKSVFYIKKIGNSISIISFGGSG